MTEKSPGIRKWLSVLERHPIGLTAQDFPRWPFHAVGGRVQELSTLRRRLAELKAATANCRATGEVFDKLQGFPEFRTDQKRSEFLSLLALLAGNPPNFLCEIGTAYGGTLFQLARVCAPDATIISVDVGTQMVRRLVYRQMGLSRQQIICIRGDSSSPETVKQVTSVLGRNRLDCLLIDGDHSLDGVTADFANYSPLVQAGGKIVFHDIIPDYENRFGIQGSGWAGEVHKFWQQLRSQFSFEEFVENPEQDGYGLGVIDWLGAAAPKTDESKDISNSQHA